MKKKKREKKKEGNVHDMWNRRAFSMTIKLRHVNVQSNQENYQV